MSMVPLAQTADTLGMALGRRNATGARAAVICHRGHRLCT